MAHLLMDPGGGASITKTALCRTYIVPFAEAELSILCFGDASLLDQDRPIQKFEIPSWTGVNGKHYLEHVVDGHLYPSTTFQNYKIMGRLLQVTCACISTDPSILIMASQRQQQQQARTTVTTLTPRDLPPTSNKKKPTCHSTTEDSVDEMDRWILSTSVRLPGHKSSKTAILDEIYGDDPYEDFELTKQAETLLQFIPVEKKESLFWNDDASSQCTRFEFDLTEDIDVSKQYVILSGIAFDHGSPGWNLSPVIKKEQDYYKAIAVCHIENPDYFFSDYSVPEVTFMI
ncbi:hypothetical protein BDB00DRAFT_786741 [Zychaea mexicana]|uniref:uncharacterized protein n=1 Tax=Zychaea mexicana TaxID=64656 RepID=UPI0022FE8B2E|nr:uncharacterized protein BDB00DRAFT_786741 [Zychaea mexicana]KAI9494887.1 hypothetical protein BDB00DRAFT_786741 [Zychaea mexicana]